MPACPVAAAQQEPFRTATRLVEVHVVVTDRSRKPVEGLTRDDFTIAEDGVAQTLSIFEVRDTRAPRTDASVTSPQSEEGISVSNQTPGVPGSRRSEERRVGKGWRAGRGRSHE